METDLPVTQMEKIADISDIDKLLNLADDVDFPDDLETNDGGLLSGEIWGAEGNAICYLCPERHVCIHKRRRIKNGINACLVLSTH